MKQNLFKPLTYRKRILYNCIAAMRSISSKARPRGYGDSLPENSLQSTGLVQAGRLTQDRSQNTLEFSMENEPKMSRNFIVYQSRNRETGTLTRTLDTKHADCPAFVKDGERYIALCVEHQTMKRFASHYEAGRAIAHVSEWCKPCIAMVKNNQKFSAEAIHAYSTQVLTGNDRFYAYDKRWNDNAKKTTLTRTQDQAGMFNQSAGKPYSVRKANNAVQAKAKTARKPSAVTTRKALKKELTKPDPDQLDIVDAKTFRKRTLTSV